MVTASYVRVSSILVLPLHGTCELVDLLELPADSVLLSFELSIARSFSRSSLQPNHGSFDSHHPGPVSSDLPAGWRLFNRDCRRSFHATHYMGPSYCSFGMSLCHLSEFSSSGPCCCSRAQSITGTVQNQDLRRVDQAIVQVRDQEGTMVAQGVTNQAGEFSVIMVPGGWHLFRQCRSGYLPE